jgi:hypothetical protein
MALTGLEWHGTGYSKNSRTVQCGERGSRRYRCNAMLFSRTRANEAFGLMAEDEKKENSFEGFLLLSSS